MGLPAIPFFIKFMNMLTISKNKPNTIIDLNNSVPNYYRSHC